MTLIGYWPLNESSGNTAYDHSGNENHGTINDGGDSTVPGANGILGQNSYNFDGSDDKVRVPDDVTLNIQSAITVSLWINPDNLNDGDFHRVLSNGDATHSWAFYQRDTNSEFSVILYDANNDSVHFHSFDLSENTWQKVSFTYDKTGSFVVYVDGLEIFSETADGSDLEDASGFDFYIGGESGDNQYFDGKISEVRIYDRPLTASEIQYLYTVGKRGLQTTSKKSS